MNLEDFRDELLRLFRAAEDLDPAKVLEVFEEIIEPLRGIVCVRRMDAEVEALKKRFKKDAIIG